MSDKFLRLAGGNIWLHFLPFQHRMMNLKWHF